MAALKGKGRPGERKTGEAEPSPRIINKMGRESVDGRSGSHGNVWALVDLMMDSGANTAVRRESARKVCCMAREDPSNAALAANCERLLDAAWDNDTEVSRHAGLALRHMREVTVRALYGQLGSEDTKVAGRALDTMLRLDELHPPDPAFMELARKVLVGITDGKKDLS